MHKRFLVLSFLAVIALSGCAGVKQYVPMPNQSVKVEDPSKARIYVVRPATMGAAVPMAILDNGLLIGDTGPKSYLCWERDPGDITITGKSENSSWVKINVKSNEIYYIQQSIKMGFAIARNKLELVDNAKGENLIKKAKPAKVVERPKK